MRAVANCDAIQQVARRRKQTKASSSSSRPVDDAMRMVTWHASLSLQRSDHHRGESAGSSIRFTTVVRIYISDACMRFGHRSPRCYKAKAKLVDRSGNASTLSPATASTPGGFVPSMHLRLPSSSTTIVRVVSSTRS